MLKFNYRYARPNAPLPLLIVDKIIRAKHGYRKTCFEIAGYYFFKSFNAQTDLFSLLLTLGITVPPTVQWIFKIRKHGLLRGTRKWIRLLVGIVEKWEAVYGPKFWGFIFRTIGNSFFGRLYRRLPKITKTFLLILWYGIASYLLYSGLSPSGPSKSDLECARVLKNLFPSFNYGSRNPTAIVYTGGMIIIGLVHFSFSLGDQILNKIDRKIFIKLIIER